MNECLSRLTLSSAGVANRATRKTTPPTQRLAAAWFLTPGHETVGSDTGDKTWRFAGTELLTAVMTAFVMASANRGTLAKDVTAGIAAYMLVIATFMLLDDMEESGHKWADSLES